MRLYVEHFSQQKNQALKDNLKALQVQISALQKEGAGLIQERLKEVILIS